MMSSTSKSNQRKAKKLNLATEPTWNWLQLPSDITANILQRIGVVEILENAQKVCTAWREICKDICKDPAIWRVVYMGSYLYPGAKLTRENTCKLVVDKSQGQLVDLTIVNSENEELLLYVAERSSQLKRLEIACCHGSMYESWSKVFKKFSLLGELSLYNTVISERGIEKAGRYCPLLKILKVNQKPDLYWDEDYIEDGIATAIGENLPGLTHLELIGNNMSDYGLQTILDGCPQLESLDLRGCLYINLKGALRKRCSKKIKHLKLPKASLQDCPYIYEYRRGRFGYGF